MDLKFNISKSTSLLLFFFQDFIVTVVATFLWLVSTSAWAKALTDIKVASGPRIVQELMPCKKSTVICHFGSVTSMGSLNVSVVCMLYLCNF